MTSFWNWADSPYFAVTQSPEPEEKMTRKECGCYDGPYSEDTPRTLVSVRCVDHEKVPVKPGHSLIQLDKTGKASFAPREKRRGYGMEAGA